MSHAIRLGEDSTKSENIAIPTLQIQGLKWSQENCMRNWLDTQRFRGTKLRRGGHGRAPRTTSHQSGGRRRGRRAWPGFETTRQAHASTPGATGVEGAGGSGGPGCSARGRWQGLAGLRTDAPSEARCADGSQAGRRPRRSPAPHQTPPRTPVAQPAETPATQPARTPVARKSPEAELRLRASTQGSLFLDEI